MSEQDQKSGKILDPKPVDQLSQQGIHVSEETIDVTSASWDESLSKVWVAETSGELCASIDRLIFETPITAAVRFMEPHGFNLNLENILACLDSMKFGVFAKTTGKKVQDREVAKKIIPALFMKLPQRNAKGHLLRKFYEEIAKYESELTRLQQYEAQSRKTAQEAIKDETGRSALAQVQRDNELLREEVNRLSRRVAQLSAAIESVPLHGRETLIPAGIKICQVRQVKEHENLVHLKSEVGQYTFPLSQLNGIPAVGARAFAVHDGGQVRAVWVFDPLPAEFQYSVAKVLVVDGSRVKVRGQDRANHIVDLTPAMQPPQRGDTLILKIASGSVVDWTQVNTHSFEHVISEVFDQQVRRLVGQDGLDTDSIVVSRDRSTKSKSKRGRRGRAA